MSSGYVLDSLLTNLIKHNENEAVALKALFEMYSHVWAMKLNLRWVVLTQYIITCKKGRRLMFGMWVSPLNFSFTNNKHR